MTLFIKKTKNKNGKIKETIWVNFVIENKRFRKSLKLENTKANLKKAEKEILPTLQYKLLNGELKRETKEIPTVDQFIEYSFELHKGRRIQSTINGHKQNYNRYIKDIFGDKKLNKIHADEITIWQNSLQEKNRLSKAYIKKIRGILYTLFQDAIQKKYILANPINEVKGLKERENPKIKRLKLMPFISSEIQKLLTVTEKQEKNLLATLFFTGLRMGECIGLKWDCVDFENKTIHVRQQIVNGIEKQILKTSKSNRLIPIIDSLMSFLQEQYKLTGKKKSYIFMTERTNTFIAQEK